MTYSLRPARLCDAAKLPDVEQAASELFRTMPELGWLADAGNIPEDLHRARIPDGTTWVAEGADGEILGFLSAEATPDALHILELSVLPAHHRQGIGTGLIEMATAFAREKELGRVTLTTFRDVPWNAPFYARVGFSMIEDVNLDAYLLGHLDDEATLGMPREKRCAMERAIR